MKRAAAPAGAGEANAAQPLRVEPLTPERWPDLEALFAAPGCSVARHCWCMYYRVSGAKAVMPAGSDEAKANRAALKRLVDAGRPPGLIGYRDGKPVGWISLGPRADFAKLARSPVMKPVDDRPVWSILCFVVPSQFRRRGVARALLEAAVPWAKAQGAMLIEGYPVDREGRSSDDSMWFGAKSMFDAVGFEEVARRKAGRPVMRLEVR